MLAKSKKQKGKRLEKYVASKLSKIFRFAYSRADSGSGKYQKEDVSLPDDIPLFIECKNQAELSLKNWWNQTTFHCPHSKYPILIYKLNYQKEPTVVTNLISLIKILREVKDDMTELKLSMSFGDFLDLVKSAYSEKNERI